MFNKVSDLHRHFAGTGQGKVAGCGEQIEGVGEAAVFHKVQEIF
jgi:hypothetical protein